MSLYLPPYRHNTLTWRTEQDRTTGNIPRNESKDFRQQKKEENQGISTQGQQAWRAVASPPTSDACSAVLPTRHSLSISSPQAQISPVPRSYGEEDATSYIKTVARGKGEEGEKARWRRRHDANASPTRTWHISPRGWPGNLVKGETKCSLQHSVRCS